MNKIRILIFLLFICITTVVFFPTVTQGKIPFPGDLLLAEYQPWKSYSHNGISPGGIPNKAQYFDAIRQMYPWQALITEQIKQGSFPFWNPYNFSGAPLFANTQSGVLFPLKFLYVILPQHIAWTALVILQVFLTFIATFLLARSVGMSFKGAALASISFGLCLYQTSFLEYNIMGHFLYLLSFAIWGIERFWVTRRTRYATVILFATTLSWFAGHLQLAGVFITAVIMYSFVKYILYKSTTHASFLYTIIFLCNVSILLAAPQLIPTIELIVHSSRSAQPSNFLIEHLLIQPYQLFSAIIPDLFGNPATRNFLLPDSYPTKALSIGAVSFFLAISTLSLNKKNKIIKTFWLTLLPFLILITRNPISETIFRLNLPIIGTSSPSNMIFVSSLFFSLLAGFGFDSIFSIEKRKFALFIVFPIITLLFAFFLPILGIQISKNNLMMTMLIIVAGCFLLILGLYVQSLRKPAILGIILLTIVELTYYAWKFNPFVPNSYIYPPTSISQWLTDNSKTTDRFWGYGSAVIQPNINTIFKSFSPDGYDPLYPKKYSEIINSSKDGLIKTEYSSQNRSDAGIYPGWGENEFVSNQYRLKILSLLGVKTILSRAEDPISEKTFPPALFPKVAQFDGWSIYSNTQSVPRTFISDSVFLYSSPEDFSNKFFSSVFNPSLDILTDENIQLAQTDKPLISKAIIEKYYPNKVVINAQTNKSSLLFLSDTYYPGWKAYLDANPVHIIRANYAFRAILLPPGNHTVIFTYSPITFTFGLILSAITALILTTAVFILNQRNTKKK